MKNKHSPLFIPLIIATVITVILGLTLLALEIRDTVEDDTTVADGTEAPPQNEIPTAIFKSNLEEYEKYMDVTDEKYLILVNKTSTIDESYTPERLVPVKDARKEIELSETAEKALEAMFIEMRAQGFDDVFVTSAYRSYANQKWLFYDYYIPLEQATGLSYEKAKEKVLTYSALPGTSEHHTGLSVDLMTNSMRELDESFADNPVYPWLLENAWKFGFILRYPEDKTDITGYSFEPWHYRFVGRYHAYKIHEQGLCLEEYLGS